MSKTATTKTAVRSAAEIEIEIAEALARRKEINGQLTALRVEHRAAVAAEERARAEEIGARILAAAGNPDAILAIAAEVAETADSGAAPSAPEDADDQQHEHREWGGDRGVDL